MNIIAENKDTLTEEAICSEFLEKGFVTFPVDDLSTLKQVRNKLYKWVCDELRLEQAPVVDVLLNNIADYVAVESLNNFRLKLIQYMTNDKEIRDQVYIIGKQYIDWIVGNELAMQRCCNLSIQLPDDDSSLLPLHADVWSGNSPYEIVFWLPLVDCFNTKSMYLLEQKKTDAIIDNFSEVKDLSAEELYQHIESDVQFLNAPFGTAGIFSHALLHGNRINQEANARWTINVRFKSLLSPYGSKGLGESFLPYVIRPATRIGHAYRKPKCQ